MRQYLPSWIVEAVSQWEKFGAYPSPSVLSFALNLTSFVCRDEQMFVMLNSRNIYERLITLINVNKPTTDPTIKLGYIKLVSSFLEHKSGLQWIISTNFWADIMSLTLKNQTMYITKEGYKFVKSLLVKSIKINEGFCHNVMELMMAPLSKHSPCVPPNTVANVMEVRDQAIYQSLCCSLSLLTEVLQLLLENIFLENNFKILKVFTDKFNLEDRIRTLLIIAQNEEFLFDLYKLLFIMFLVEIYEQFPGKIFVENDMLAKSCYKLFDIFADNIQKGSLINILRLTYIGYTYWKSIGSFMPKCVKNADNPVPLTFENQLLMMQLYPIITVSFKMLGEKEAERKLFEDEVRDHYVDELLKKSTQPTLRMFFLWRNYLTNDPYVFDHATLAMNYLIKSRLMFTREQGVTAFQTLIYCLKDIVTVLKVKPEQISVLAKEYNYMVLLLDAIAILINEFNFTWRDSLESICVMNLSFEFLSISAWPTKVSDIFYLFVLFLFAFCIIIQVFINIW